jgi:hypothetical protein
VAAATSLVAAAPAGAARGPVVDHMVVYSNGSAKVGKVRARSTRVKVGRKRCAVATGTPLAALARVRPGKLRFRDYGSCGKRARDSGGLYVKGIRRDIAQPGDPFGWVYKVGNKAAPAGAGDPSGPFGRGRLRSRQRVTWFWCVFKETGDDCQRTLALKETATAPGSVTVRVRGYDNAGRGVNVAGATVSGGGATTVTAGDGTATLGLPAGKHKLEARKDGLVRSHPVGVDVP